MKKVISVLLIFVMLFSLVACNNKVEPETTEPTTSTESSYWYKNDNIALNNFIAMKLTFYEFTVKDEDLQMYINYYILLPNAEYKEIKEGTAEKDDYLNVMVTTKDESGNIIEKYTTDESGYNLYIGLGDYLDGLDDALIGASVGEPVKFNAPITIDNKTVNATVEATIQYFIEMEYPEATDELAQKAGWQDLEAFKNEYKSKLEVEYGQAAYEIFLSEAKEKIIAEVFNHPEEMVESYLVKYQESLDFYAALYGVTPDEYLAQYVQLSREDWEKQIHEKALDDVETELMLNAVLEVLGLELSGNAYDAYLQRMADSAGYSSAASLEADMEEQGAMQDLIRELTMNYGYDTLLNYTNLRLVDWNSGTVIFDWVENPDETN